MTACLTQLLARLPYVDRSKPNANNMESKTDIIQIILNGLKLAGHGNQSMNKLRKKYLLSGLSEKYKDSQKFAPDSHSHLLGEELEDSLKKAKGRHYSLQALKQSAGLSQAHKEKLVLTCHLASQKTAGQPEIPGLAKSILHKQIDNI